MELCKPFRLFTVLLCLLLGASLVVFNLEKVIQKAEYGFTNAQVEEVYQKLYLQSGLSQKPPLHILDTSTINAWTDGEDVTITTGILRTMSSVDEIALVLGHELGHVINYDVLHNQMEDAVKFPLNQSYKEAAADKIGGFMMMRAGYDICKGKKIMQTFRDNFGSDAGATGHPDNAFRADELNLPQCQNGFFSNWL